MNKYYKLLCYSIIIIGLTACSNPLHLRSKYHNRHHHKSHQKQPLATQIEYSKPTPEKEKAYKETMQKVAKSTLADARYNKMTLDTAEKKAWFKTLMYRLWDRQITSRQFITEGLAKYPTHYYEFAFVAHGFQKNS